MLTFLPVWEEERLSRAFLQPHWLQGKDWNGSHLRLKPYLLHQFLQDWAAAEKQFGMEM